MKIIVSTTLSTLVYNKTWTDLLNEQPLIHDCPFLRVHPYIAVLCLKGVATCCFARQSIVPIATTQKSLDFIIRLVAAVNIVEERREAGEKIEEKLRLKELEIDGTDGEKYIIQILLRFHEILMLKE